MIRVLIVDDSAVVRRVLTEELSSAPDIEVVGTATDPYVARDRILALKPDVLTLDIEMPRMDGLTFLGKLMQHQPMPVIVVSSITPEGSAAAVQALQLGAVDVVAKPGGAFTVAEICESLVQRIRIAARASVQVRQPTEGSIRPALKAPTLRTTDRVLAIGASTGGTQAIRTVLTALPQTTPGTVVVQHMPEHFTAAFAERLNNQCAMEVREARDGDRITTGVALVAPGNRHMVVQRSGARYVAHLKDGPPVHYQRPSVDVLFHSAARHCGPNCVGVILTGMGEDGASGMVALREAGAHTIGQDEASCVVYGMPRAAAEAGGVAEVRPLDEIAAAIVAAFSPSGACAM